MDLDLIIQVETTGSQTAMEATSSCMGMESIKVNLVDRGESLEEEEVVIGDGILKAQLLKAPLQLICINNNLVFF